MNEPRARAHAAAARNTGSGRASAEVISDLEPDDQKICVVLPSWTSKSLVLVNVGESQMGDESSALIVELQERSVDGVGSIAVRSNPKWRSAELLG